MVRVIFDNYSRPSGNNKSKSSSTITQSLDLSVIQHLCYDLGVYYSMLELKVATKGMMMIILMMMMMMMMMMVVMVVLMVIGVMMFMMVMVMLMMVMMMIMMMIVVRNYIIVVSHITRLLKSHNMW
jgi:hypothetical protein